jgi:hypothetical protein
MHRMTTATSTHRIFTAIVAMVNLHTGGLYLSQKKITQINVINAEIARIQRTSDSVITITQTSSSPFFN